MNYIEEVKKHYDMLIDEGNDPVNDPPALKDYMYKWDGNDFFDALELDSTKSVLEIGVGTGRLALKVAPFCGRFTGIDLSPKTIDRAKEHLINYATDLICDDFLTHYFDEKFQVVYSCLTFLHIQDKVGAVQKVYDILDINGRFVLSIDKNTAEIIDYGNRKLRVFPDEKGNTEKILKSIGFFILNIFETELAYIFVAVK